jgi:pimeloyl-ACP methyl ester carboxylesterase
LIWGANDPYLGREMAAPSLDFCRDGQLVILENATHWLHLEQPSLINELVYQFLGPS